MLPKLSHLQVIPKALREIRLHISPVNPTSSGLRDFIVDNYSEIKRAAGNVPIMIRESASVPARAFFVSRKDGAEEKVVFEGLSRAEITELFSSVLSKYAQNLKH